MRKVGRRKEPQITFSASAELLAEGARFNDEIHRLPTGNTTHIPKGLYRFKSFEEADRHQQDCLVAGMVTIRTQSAAQQDTPLAVTPPIQTRMAWRVTAVKALPGFRLHVRFVDGIEGTVDLAALIHSPRAGVFASLVNSLLFAQVFVENGAVTWPGEIDLAPDAMYAEIKKAGTWVLQ